MGGYEEVLKTGGENEQLVAKRERVLLFEGLSVEKEKSDMEQL